MWEKPENSNPFSLLMDDQFSVERQEGQAAHLFLAVFPASETTTFPLVDKMAFPLFFVVVGVGKVALVFTFACSTCANYSHFFFSSGGFCANEKFS